MRGELYIEDGKVEQYAVSQLAPGLAAVLMAGNFDAPTDVLHVMFNQNQVRGGLCLCARVFVCVAVGSTGGVFASL
jgi:hypothetical protein